jgi:hypothetical protein
MVLASDGVVRAEASIRATPRRCNRLPVVELVAAHRHRDLGDARCQGIGGRPDAAMVHDERRGGEEIAERRKRQPAHLRRQLPGDMIPVGCHEDRGRPSARHAATALS